MEYEQVLSKRGQETVDLLMKAFFKGELVHGKECDCAVGVICSNNPSWNMAISPMYNEIYPDFTDMISRDVPFEVYDLLEIEHAFEGREKRKNLYIPTLDRYNDPDGFEGLTRVFDWIWEKEMEEGDLTTRSDQNLALYIAS